MSLLNRKPPLFLEPMRPPPYIFCLNILANTTSCLHNFLRFFKGMYTSYWFSLYFPFFHKKEKCVNVLRMQENVGQLNIDWQGNYCKLRRPQKWYITIRGTWKGTLTFCRYKAIKPIDMKALLKIMGCQR